MNISLKRTKAKSSPAPTLNPDQIAPIQGSFDLSGDAFGKAERLRRGLITVSLSATAILTALLLTGAYFGIQAERANSSAAQLSDQVTELTTTLNQLDQAEGFAASQLRQHAIERQSIVKDAVADEIDVIGLTRQLLSLASTTGVRVTQITYAQSEQQAPEQAADADAAAGDSADVAADAAATAPAQIVTSVTISASGPATAIPLFVQQVGAIPGLVVEPNPKFQTTNDVTELTLNADITADRASERAKEVASQDAQGLPTESPASLANDPAAEVEITEPTSEIVDDLANNPEPPVDGADSAPSDNAPAEGTQ